MEIWKRTSRTIVPRILMQMATHTNIERTRIKIDVRFAYQKSWMFSLLLHLEISRKCMKNLLDLRIIITSKVK